ncbi:MAG: hypothetical protein RL768_1348 [Nitrospirota bacterium]
MREVRQVRRPDYLGAGDHVQGIRLVYHGLFRQDEAADRRHIETDDNDDSTLRFACDRSSAGDDVHTIAGSRVNRHGRNFRCRYRIIRQRTGIRHTVQLKVTCPG